MSADYNFKISIAKRGNSDLSSVGIIENFLKAGWSLYSEKNEITYTDVGDNDNFHFLTKPIGEIEYFNIVNEKEKNNEMIAFALFCYEELRYRIDVIITPEYEILISPDDATKKMLIPTLNILDVNWYLCKLLPPLTNKNMLVESFSFMFL